MADNPQPPIQATVSVQDALSYAEFNARIEGIIEGLQRAKQIRHDQMFRPAIQATHASTKAPEQPTEKPNGLAHDQ